jgi:hypothetical protein
MDLNVKNVNVRQKENEKMRIVVKIDEIRDVVWKFAGGE